MPSISTTASKPGTWARMWNNVVWFWDQSHVHGVEVIIVMIALTVAAWLALNPGVLSDYPNLWGLGRMAGEYMWAGVSLIFVAPHIIGFWAVCAGREELSVNLRRTGAICLMGYYFSIAGVVTSFAVDPIGRLAGILLLVIGVASWFALWKLRPTKTKTTVG